MTDAKWALIAGMIPPAKRGGNARTVNLLEVVNGLLCALGTPRQNRYVARTPRRETSFPEQRY